MTLESKIEGDSVLEIKRAFGIESIKVGHSGWPDRLVPFAPGRCIWLEFKQPKTGVISQRQKIRKKDLNAMGHEVFYPTSKREAVAIVAQARRKVGL